MGRRSGSWSPTGAHPPSAPPRPQTSSRPPSLPSLGQAGSSASSSLPSSPSLPLSLPSSRSSRTTTAPTCGTSTSLSPTASSGGHAAWSTSTPATKSTPAPLVALSVSQHLLPRDPRAVSLSAAVLSQLALALLPALKSISLAFPSATSPTATTKTTPTPTPTPTPKTQATKVPAVAA